MKYIIIGGLLVVAVFILILSSIPIGKEPLTELYFVSYENYPKSMVVGENASFSFVIRNLEYQKLNYTYVVSSNYNNKTIVLKEKTVELSDKQQMTVPVSFSFDEKFERAKIEVALSERDESIFFWVAEKK
jgi:uncharacterized membrane protein